MPNAPIALPIVPSRLALGLHGALAMVAGGLALVFAPLPLALAVSGLLLAVVVWVARTAPRGELQAMPRQAGGWSWRWRGPDGEWREVGLVCDYLGPWLIGLRLDGRRLWLWPDSGSAEALRTLRRVLLQQRH